MNRNGGYLFEGLCRRRVYDRKFFPQCFHCYGFNHFAENCPIRNNPARRAKCSGQYKTKNFRSQLLKSLNRLKAKVNDSKDHEATSCFCPVLIEDQNQIQ